ncbi:MAG: phenylalanine--tRNA ligase subunit alpha [Candidatus Marinimicrobia bacterium]|nr:phenylalanine--tRNA ligase subunit alpha [Candidatus Neomarinimicrobiota bacterium]
MDLYQEAKQNRIDFQSEIDALELTEQSVENLRIKYLGKKGIIRYLFQGFSSVKPEEKKEYGQFVNVFKNEVEGKIEELQESLIKQKTVAEVFDHTMPGIRPQRGSLHPISLTMREIVKIFQEMGFDIEFGPEVETDYYNFAALNFPDNHPARDMQDTFFVEKDILLRTHTSPIQVRAMQKYQPPMRLITPGRVFRNEAVSARSHCIFHQIEGLYIDENVTFADLKTTIDIFAKRYFGKNVKTRFRPSFFPFVEPGAEVDVTCFICGGEGCRVCKKTGWLEIMGCGMVDPNVLEESGIDSEKYSGYAFGMGPDRITMLKYGIDDIRLFFDSDIKFLKQFK